MSVSPTAIVPLPSSPPIGIQRYLSKFEKHPKTTISHEFGIGSPCNRCECPGLDLHYWRKICKVCECRLDEHDVVSPDEQDHGAIVTRKLFGGRGKWAQSSSSSASSRESLECLVQRVCPGGRETTKPRSGDCGRGGDVGIRLIGSPALQSPTRLSSNAGSPQPIRTSQLIYENVNLVETKQQKEQWAWTPSGDWRLARRYLLSLAEEERPLKGSAGAQLRRQRLAQQLPYHDSDVHSSRANRAEREQRLHREFIEHIKHQVVGIAEVIDCAQHKAHFAALIAPSAASLTSVRRLDDAAQSCRNCRGKFKCTDVGVVTDHERNNAEAIWHPRCFTCSVCNQLLVDLLYFFRDGKYFCGRHYGEKVYPRCAGCDELIFAREYTLAEQKPWHLEHFCCFGCDRHLSGQRYVVKEEQPFCVDCYMHKFARKCTSCNNKIAPFEQRVSYGELHWHSDKCFSCTCCGTSLSNQKFLLKGEHPFCSSECKNRFGI